MANPYQLQHDFWLVLTLLSIIGWILLGLSLRGIFHPMKKIWPELYMILMATAVALFCVVVEIGCAELAAGFYPNVIIYPANATIRLIGRGVEVLGVWGALSVRYLIKLKGE